ncbi:MAG: immunoglobulin domain-containing protein [Bacteroidetes bacterium]|nr:immunoglobulin domain-containing protein [Bacteroidota bacterium]
MKNIYNWLLLFTILVASSTLAHARQNGISGQSQLGCGGVDCHAANSSAATTVSILGTTGTITMAAGSQRTFTALVAHATQPSAGINISIKNAGGANIGEFTAGTGLQILNGELTHTIPQPIIGSPRQAAFQFTWTAPAAAGTYTLRASGNAVNGNGKADPLDIWSNTMAPITIIVPGVQVTSPNGNEQWCRGTSKNITWTSSGITNVDIALSIDAGASWTTLAMKIPASPATWSWAIPTSLPVGGTNLIRISDNANALTNDQSNANFYILSAPTITEQPTNDSVCVGQSKTFTVTTDNPSAYSYQWRKNNTSITGATAASYTITSVTAASAGSYTCTVTGCSNNVISDSAVLLVFLTPAITSQPHDTTVCPGSAAELKVSAMGAGLSYQWKRNGFPVATGNEAIYTIPSVTSSDTGSYEVVVTGRCTPPATSTIAKLKFPSAPQFFTQPSDTFICAGNELKLKVEASGNGVTYSWKRNGNIITGVTGNSYTMPAVSTSDTGIIAITATNSCNFSTTVSVHVQLGVAPSITTQPSDSTTTPGATVSFKVVAKGTALTYQWQKNNTDIPNQKSATLTITNVKPSDSGMYSCIIKNSCGQVTSLQAKLKVNGSSAPSIGYNAAIIDFGCVLPSTTKDSTLVGVIENVGGSPLIVTSVSITGSGSTSFSIISGGGGFTLAPNEKRTISVRFAPTTTGGQLATLTVVSNSVSSPTPTALLGQGCLSNLNVKKIIFDTTSPGNSRDSVIQVCNNTASAFAVVTAIISGGDSQFKVISTDVLPRTLQPAECMMITIRYMPNSLNGATATLHVGAGTSAGAEEHQIQLIGTPIKTNSVDDYDVSNSMLSSVHTFPNPSSDNVSFEIEAVKHEIASLTIIDAEGRLIYRKSNLELNEGVNNLYWNGNTLVGTRAANGHYTAIINTSIGVRSTQFMIVR